MGNYKSVVKRKKIFTQKNDPTPSEIEEMCKEIRKGWSIVEKRKRKGEYYQENHWTPPEINLKDFPEVAYRDNYI